MQLITAQRKENNHEKNFQSHFNHSSLGSKTKRHSTRIQSLVDKERFVAQDERKEKRT